MKLSRHCILGALAVLAVGLLPDVPATAALLAKAPQARPMVAELIGETIVLPDADRQAIRAVIERQLQAFLRDDGTAAFSYATPSIQGIFQTPDNFMSMVKNGYQPVYRPQAVTFRDIIDLHGAPAQRVLVVGPDGVPVIAVYPMQRMPDGSWLINGCYLLAYPRDEA
ncbi:MAG: DUF4864 domain-containing protein [Rhodospirillales bacterium]|nr:DUF4864 domain-containing protein [Rhodospirillales bacterium]